MNDKLTLLKEFVEKESKISLDFFKATHLDNFTGEVIAFAVVSEEITKLINEEKIVDETLNLKLARLEYLENLINNPEIENFLEGIKIEAAHQTEKWGTKHEEAKFPHDYSLVMDKLKGKQALAIWDKNAIKYKHHLVTMAAVCYNAHRQIKKEGTTLNNFFTHE